MIICPEQKLKRGKVHSGKCLRFKGYLQQQHQQQQQQLPARRQQSLWCCSFQGDFDRLDYCKILKIEKEERDTHESNALRTGEALNDMNNNDDDGTVLLGNLAGTKRDTIDKTCLCRRTHNAHKRKHNQEGGKDISSTSQLFKSTPTSIYTRKPCPKGQLTDQLEEVFYDGRVVLWLPHRPMQAVWVREECSPGRY